MDGPGISSVEAIAGVSLVNLVTHRDTRGGFTELLRNEWPLEVAPIQWNVVRSNQGVLRGVHVHPTHDDYLTIVSGKATVGLTDLRSASPTEGRSTVLQLSGDSLTPIVIPHGVAHGFLFHEPSIHVYAVSHYWDLDDELACLWSDPDLGIEWPFVPTYVSERDATAMSLSQLRAALEPVQPIG